MIQAGIGLSEDANTAAATNQATRAAMAQLGTVQADAVLLFASHHHCEQYPSLYQVTRTVCGTENIVGCSGQSVLTIQGEIEQAPAVAALAIASDEIQIRPFLLERKVSELSTLEETLFGVFQDAQRGNRLLVLFPDAFTVNPTEFIRSVEKIVRGIPIVGAAPSGDLKARETFQWVGPRLCRRGVAGFLLSGAFTPRSGVTEGCQPIGDPFIITKAEGNVVYEIGRLPAIKLLRNTLASLPPEDQEQAKRSLVAGIVINEAREEFGRGDFLVRNILSVDPQSGAMALGELVRPGQTIQFHVRDADAAMDDLRETVAHLAQALDEEPPRFGFYFNCTGRGSRLYGRSNTDTAIIREFLGNFPLIGFNGNAQIAPVGKRNLVHNYTGALVVV